MLRSQKVGCVLLACIVLLEIFISTACRKTENKDSATAPAETSETEDEEPYVIYMSPAGKVFTQEDAKRLAKKKEITLLCGHYEGVDQRLIDEIVDEEISIGDFVLTGGEIPACLVADAVGRLCDGVLSEPECYEKESFEDGVLEYPQYTRPPVWMGREVPEVLISGHHANIEKWRAEAALEKTREKRPDLLEIKDPPEEERS